MRGRQIVIPALAAVAGFAAVALSTAYIVSKHQAGPGVAVASVGGPFELVDDGGAAVTDRTLAGKPSVMYFGYTYCPDVCPTTLLDMSRWIKKLGPEADKLNYVFVTVDPERDTPQLMHSYLSSFDHHIRGFTGTAEQVAKIAREYRVYFKRVPTDDGGYLMDHSAVVYLMGASGNLVGVIPYQEDDATALTKLRKLAEAGAPSS
jgi:protein SCO1